MFGNGEVLVRKFGGSSMGSLDRIRKVAELVAEQAGRGRRQVVVVSAMGDTTDELIGMMLRMHPLPDRRELDQLMATGEIAAAALGAAALQNIGVPARSYHAANLEIRTRDLGGNEAEIETFARLQHLAGFLQPGHVAVVAGFQGITPSGDLTTLGRGGSDITAVALARDLGQKVCEKFTDEDGVFSADPRIIPNVRKIWHLNYDEMETLARFGSGILHPRAVAYARTAGIRIHVRSSFSRAEGSVVGPDGDEQVPIKSLTCDRRLAMIKFFGLSRRPDATVIQRFLAEIPWHIQHWSDKNADDGVFTVIFKLQDSFQALPNCWMLAEAAGAQEVKFHARLYFVTLVGVGFADHPHLVRQLQERLQRHAVEPLLLDHDGVRVSLAFPEETGAAAMTMLHSVLLESIRP